MLQQEKNYDFKKSMLEVHEKDLVDKNIKPNSTEFVFEDGLTIYISEFAGEVILTAVKDFTDYLFTSMGVSVMIKRGTPSQDKKTMTVSLASETDIFLDEAEGYRGYRIDTEKNRINVYGFDERGAAQALYYLEDIMSIRKAPYIPLGIVKHKPMFSPQMVHSGYGLDQFPNEHLSAIAHEGRDAILVFVKDADTTTHGYIDFNELVYRAAKYGIDVYAYSYIKSKYHPDHEDAEKYYESTYGELFRKCPGIKGIVLVGESVFFPSRDPQISNENVPDKFSRAITK